jgi:hypothetical protein
MEIEELKQIQVERGLGHVHLVWLGDSEDGFTVAHTDAERAEFNLDGRHLDTCELVVFCMDEGPFPEAPVGVYIATPHEPDTYSEDYGAYPWDFEPLPERRSAFRRMLDRLGLRRTKDHDARHPTQGPM